MASAKKKHDKLSTDEAALSTSEEMKPDIVKAEDYFHKIALAAYYKSEARGFEPGYELDDWLEAEQAYYEEYGQ